MITDALLSWLHRDSLSCLQAIQAINDKIYKDERCAERLPLFESCAWEDQVPLEIAL